VAAGYPRNIFIDGRFRTHSSASSSDFVFELVRAVNLPRKCAAFVNDVSVPVSWYSVDKNNSKLFFRETGKGSNRHTEFVGMIDLSPANYTGTSLATAIQQSLTDASPHGFTYTATYDSATGAIAVTVPALKQFDWSVAWTVAGQVRTVSKSDPSQPSLPAYSFEDGTGAMTGTHESGIYHPGGEANGAWDDANTRISWPTSGTQWTT